MKVNIQYFDGDSLTVEEVVRNAQHHFGKRAEVVISPDSMQPHDLIMFALSQMISHEQFSLLFDKGANYNSEIRKLRDETLFKVAELLDTVIVDNEAKLE